jgi:DNA-directed RNA polymerase subunit beta'
VAVTTIGRMLVNESLPDDLRDDQRELNKKQIGVLFKELAERYPDRYVDTLQRLNDIGRLAATEYGGVSSVRLSDLQLPPEIKAYRKALQQRVQAIAQDPRRTLVQKNEEVIALMRRSIPVIQRKLEEEATSRNNVFALSIAKGYRGSPAQLTQMLFGNTLVADHRDRPIPVPGLHGYAEGITDAEYWADAYGSRKGYMGVQFSTARTGFLSKQLAQMAQRLKVVKEDCGTWNGLLADPGDAEILGAVLAQDNNGVKAGTVIDKKEQARLKGKVLIRSVASCQADEGICRKCSGQRENGDFPPIGSYVGLTAARIIAEPATQTLALAAKHVGGQVGVNDSDISGFDEINQFLQVPKQFKGGAVLAPKDGRVNLIVKAPQGGYYVKVGDAQVHIPIERELTVKKGQVMEAGDTLSDGTPNPAEIAQYKGLGEGRSYFVGAFRDMLKRNGIPSHRRNIEVLSRAFFDKVQITAPDGIGDWAPGEVAPYGEIQAHYKPRKGSELRALGRSEGWYLEEPVMHYTIGTRLTPRVVKQLQEQNIKQANVHAEPPGFEPFIVRAMDAAAHDPDWKTQMGAFNLKRSYLRSATHGAKSRFDSTSPVPSLMDPTRL